MRMVHYFLGMALAAVPALLATAGTGIFHDGSNLHLSLGLFAAIVTVALHTLLILFMIVTGKLIKEASASRRLAPSFLGELNRFFAEKRAYPLSGLAAVSIVAVAVLGYAQRAFGVPSAVHMLLGILAVLFNLWVMQLEYQVLRENQDLLDRTARALDAFDRAAAARGESPEHAGAVQAPAHPVRNWLLVAASAWAPYLYWGLVEWRGDFRRVSTSFLVLTAAVSAAALIAAWAARRRGAAAS